MPMSSQTPRKVLLSRLSPVREQARNAAENSIRQNYSGALALAKDGLRLLP